ncbi:MAG: tRNA (N(6)-L-threonylcarbamoyladenosine(37)-C(2))-methylthiotransferase MtaB [Candidatus Krumholzibacteriota bacterium]|nr:tRNA (N(6)-L-threonylcarbamoyladenosine(37)-C(2))-methylthiotransferase MtaB [Candidatus Krumholzibacteriota bacterium]
MYKIAFDTFGCRLNQAESATLHDQFIARGYEVTDDVLEADLYVVNTCTLTSQATSKCRRRIRSVARRNPDACIAAIGCYAQTDAEQLAKIEGIDYIVGTADKLRLVEIIPSPVKLPDPLIVRGPVTKDTFTIGGVGHYPASTRANLKVQEGCDFVCAFCIIPRSRGRARSREFGDVVREAHELVRSGHRELILTGVNMGTYRDGPHTLGDVIKALTDIDGLDRIRLSSIEPTTIDDTVIDEMANGAGKLCPYLHVPLQSGDDGVLERMRRRYTAAEYRHFMERVVERVPGVGLGTDIMVGFPGESDEAFESSVRLITELPYTHIHVFSFSPRPRTSAFHMSDPVAPETVRARSARMRRLGERKKAEYYAAQEGSVLRVLFEERACDGTFVGFSDNYVKVSVETEADLSNRLADVRVTGLSRPSRGEFYATGEREKEYA